MSEQNIDFLDKVMLRLTPVPFPGYMDEDALFEQIRSDEFFHRALLLANPFVHQRFLEWTGGTLTGRRKIGKLKETLVNYYTRMYSNPTPFGFFGAVASLEWKSQPSQAIVNCIRPAVRLDMEALNDLCSHILAMPSIKKIQRYYTNNTIYTIGNQFRYTESYYSGGKIQYRLSAVETSDFLEEIFRLSRNGCTLNVLAAKLSSDGTYESEEIYSFLEELVEAQLLIPELQLTISGPDPFEKLQDTLRNLALEETEETLLLFDRIRAIRGILKEMEASPETFNDNLLQLLKLYEGMGIPADLSKLVQVDMVADLRTAIVDESFHKDLSMAIQALSYFNQNSRIHRLEEFRRNLAAKYEDAEVPLMEVIDTESGISFGSFSFQSDNALLRNVQFVESRDEYLAKSPQGDAAKAMLNKKFIDALAEKSYTIQLEEEDFEAVKAKSKVERLAPTCQVVFSIVNLEKKLLYLSTAGNGSGGNLVARFAYCSPELNKMLLDVGSFEAGHYEDAIVAEVVHIPEHRMGNLCFRPFFRNYEIPLMTRSLTDQEFQVPMDDLLISVKGGRIILHSRKLKKRIIPMITNAHNYSKDTCPVYQLLGDLQYQELIPSLNLDRADLHFFHAFVPRIQYRNVILHKASWSFENQDLQELTAAMNHADRSVLDAFRHKWQIPQRTEYITKGMTMLTDWDNALSVSNFLKYIRERPYVYLQEFLFEPDSSLVTDEQGRPFVHQCLAVFRNRLRPKPAMYSFGTGDKNLSVRKFFPGDQWVYLKLYCGVGTSDKLLKNELPPILEHLYSKELVNGFFFIRYKDPDYHLRLRFRSRVPDAAEVARYVREQLQYYTDNSLVWKIQADTYVREIERYGAATMELAESFFEADSLYNIGLLSALEGEHTYYMPFIFLAGLDAILKGFDVSLSFKATLLEEIFNSYYAEFRVGDHPSFKESLAAAEIANRKQVEQILEQDFSGLSPFIPQERLAGLLNSLEQKVAQLYKANAHLFNDQYSLRNMLPSLLHMHAIRCFSSKPRENELVAYNLLYRYYNKVLTKSKLPHATSTA